MGVLKPAVSRKHLQDAIVLDLGDLRARADAMCADARATAQQTVTEAQEERERLIATAAEEGFAKGQREGYEKGEKDGRDAGHTEALKQTAQALDQVRQQHQAALQEFERQRESMLADARRDVLVLAAELARRVTLRAVELDESVVERQLERVLALAIEPTRVVVRVHPEDRSLIKESMPKLLDRYAASAHARVEEDDTLERGSCILRTERGEIDASITTMLDEIVDAVLPKAEGA